MPARVREPSARQLAAPAEADELAWRRTEVRLAGRAAQLPFLQGFLQSWGWARTWRGFRVPLQEIQERKDSLTGKVLTLDLRELNSVPSSAI